MRPIWKFLALVFGALSGLSLTTGAAQPKGDVAWLKSITPFSGVPIASVPGPFRIGQYSPLKLPALGPHGDFYCVVGGRHIANPSSPDGLALFAPIQLIKFQAGGVRTVVRNMTFDPTDYRAFSGSMAIGPQGEVLLQMIPDILLPGITAEYFGVFRLYNQNGLVLWNHSFSEQGLRLQDPVVDASRNTYAMTFLVSASSGPSYSCVSRFTSQGRMSQVLEFPTIEGLRAFGIDELGSFYGASMFDRTQRVWGVRLESPGQRSIAFGKCDTNGDARWVKRIGSSGWDTLRSFSVDRSGGVTVSGTVGNATDPAVVFGDSKLDARKGADFLGRFNTEGALEWVIQFTGSPGSIMGDALGNTFLSTVMSCASQWEIAGVKLPDPPFSASDCSLFMGLACLGKDGHLQWATILKNPLNLTLTPDNLGGCYLLIDTLSDFSLGSKTGVYQEGDHYNRLWLAKIVPPLP